ncbi:MULTISPECIES: 1-acyl-sn-glycerol-3-phosphate acyltransferase [unclassified Legionella]|uniref:lysophospholipid acyltransferase family protein n=1 Tax=unclassified Legionella TaxID=2622702 RepID=UPI0010557F46|nr:MULTISPECIES: lysophospholipid acyltransferase family protein [unclassified Legionella]MDI9819197.1 lysophospholipid acyltransferase family protein [Legionella sp. PL877]
MRISKLRTQWIILLSIFYTASTCMQAIFKRLAGSINRDWVNKKIHRWSNRLLDLVGVKHKVINPHQVEPQPGHATIIMCNHSSLYDIPLSFKAFPNHSIRMLAKKELSKIPLMGKGMAAAEFPFIDRKHRRQAIKDLEAVRKLLQSGIVMWIAPEGTRSKDGKLAPFKKGGFITAIEANATIIPIGIRGAYDILPARTTRFNINQTAEIHIGKAIDASKYSLENKEELVDLIFQSIKNLTGEQSHPQDLKET